MAESTRPMANVGIDETVTRGAGRISCSNCSVVNSDDKKFCGQCGDILWQTCLGCATRNPVDLVYCGDCGLSLAELLEQKREETKEKLNRANQFCKDGYFSQSLSLLQSVADMNDDRFRADSNTALALIEKVKQQEQAATESVKSILALVVKNIETKHLTAAKQLIEKIPIGLRDQYILHLAENLEGELAQASALNKEIKEALAKKQYRDLLPKAYRLAEVQAPHEQLLQIIKKLERFESKEATQDAFTRLRNAKTCLSKGEYQKATELLSSVAPENCREHVETFHSIQDICWMYDQIVNGVRTTPALGKIIQRFQKFAPKETANKFVQEYNKRSKQVGTDPHAGYPIWGKPRSESSIGPQVLLWNRIASCEASDEAMASISKNDGRFAAAFGLALQGVGLASIKTNLLPAPRSIFRRSSSPKNEAWGIEVGASGIKAVQLVRGKGENDVVIQQALYSPVSSKSVIEESDKPNALKHCLEKLEANADTSIDAAVVSISGIKTLGRFFDMPRLKGKKLTEAIRYEAKIQIPIPVDQIEFDHHFWDSNDAPLRSVGLISARKDVINDTVSLFENSKFVPFQINSCCVAVHNAACFEFHEQIAQGLTLGVLDIGVDSSNLVVGNHQRLRFRTIPFGSDKLNQAIVDGLKVDRATAEQLRRQHGESIRSHQVSSLMVEPLEDFSQEINRTLNGFTTEGITVERLLVTGGGIAQHGMERFLVHGS